MNKISYKGSQSFDAGLYYYPYYPEYKERSKLYYEVCAFFKKLYDVEPIINESI